VTSAWSAVLAILTLIAGLVTDVLLGLPASWPGVLVHGNTVVDGIPDFLSEGQLPSVAPNYRSIKMLEFLGSYLRSPTLALVCPEHPRWR
jgi:hypothetical protein